MSNSSTTTEPGTPDRGVGGPDISGAAAPDVVRDAVAPGEILLEEYLKPLGVSQYRLAHTIGVSESTISKVVRGRRAITADLSVRLGKYLDVSPGFFVRMQTIHDTRIAQAALAATDIRPLSDHAA